MNRKRDIELIIPEVLGCQEEKDKKNLKFLKENDSDFCWKDLGDYQNLAASLATTLEIIRPSSRPKEIMTRNLNRLIFGKQDVGHTEKFALVKAEHEEKVEAPTSEEKKIDWSSLSVPEKSKANRMGFEEVKHRLPSIQFESVTSDQVKSSDEELEYEEEIGEESKLVGSTDAKSSRPIKKYIVLSVFLFLVIVSIVTYMFIYEKPNSEQYTSMDKIVEAPSEVVEEFIFDSLKDYGTKVDTVDLKQVEYVQEQPKLEEVVVTKKANKEENLLPKAPPKIPDPIEAPLITAEETLNKETSFTEENLSVPPPKEKELIDENEEPTFFVAVEEMPQPIGGLEGIQRKIQYPEIARRAGVEGKVYVRAFVDENGNVVNAEVVKGIGAGCDETALDAVLKTKFTPGKQRGKPIKVQVTVPILFRL